MEIMIALGILGTSRVLYAMGRDNEIPGTFGKIDKFGTPDFTSFFAVIFIFNPGVKIIGIFPEYS